MDARVSRVGQTGIYLGKCFRIFIHEKGWKVIVFSAVISAIIAWVIGDDMFSIFENTKSGIFSIVCACIWIGIFNSIQSVCRERGIIKREHRTGLHISSYVAAHMLYELVICLVETLVMLLLIYIFHSEGFPDYGVVFAGWFELFISVLLIIYSADVLGLAVSCIVKTETTAMTVMPFVLIIQLVMCGMFFELEGAANGVSYLTISKWGMEAIGSSCDMNSMPKLRDYEDYEEAKEDDPNVTLYDFVGDREYHYEYESTQDHLYKTWLILIAFTAAYGIVCVVALELVDRDKR